MKILFFVLSLTLLIGCKDTNKLKEYHYPDGSVAGSTDPEYLQEDKEEATENWNAKWAWSYRFIDHVFYKNMSDMSKWQLNEEGLMRVRSHNIEFNSKGWKHYNKFKIEDNIKYRQHLKNECDEYTEWYPYQKLVCYYVLKIEDISLGSSYSKYRNSEYRNGDNYTTYSIRFKNKDQFLYMPAQKMYKLTLDSCKELMLPQHIKFTLSKTDRWEKI